MENETAPVPMLEAFLRQAEPPGGGIVFDRFAWPLALITFSLCAFTDGPDWMLFVGIFAAWLVLFVVKTAANRQRDKLPPANKIAFDRWKKIRRIRRLVRDRRLKRRVPEPVLVTLERAARTWHDSREGLHAVAVTDPAFAAEVQVLLDASMTAAVAAAEPVVLRDEQPKKDLKQMEGDADLMARICSRIQHEEMRMRQLTSGSDSLDTESPSSLRERLESARRERAVAEAELDNLL